MKVPLKVVFEVSEGVPFFFWWRQWPVDYSNASLADHSQVCVPVATLGLSIWNTLPTAIPRVH